MKAQIEVTVTRTIIMELGTEDETNALTIGALKERAAAKREEVPGGSAVVS